MIFVAAALFGFFVAGAFISWPVIRSKWWSRKRLRTLRAGWPMWVKGIEREFPEQLQEIGGPSVIADSKALAQTLEVLKEARRVD